MNLTKKIPSFTLSEMLVVLVISAIVITLAITTLHLVQEEIKIIQGNYTKQTEIRHLKRVLLNDFNKKNVRYDSKNDHLIFENNIDTIKYEFNNQFLIRNKDTLDITVVKKTVYLDGIVVKENNIDAISIILDSNFFNKKLFVYKQNDAAMYMNQ